MYLYNSCEMKLNSCEVVDYYSQWDLMWSFIIKIWIEGHECMMHYKWWFGKVAGCTVDGMWNEIYDMW